MIISFTFHFYKILRQEYRKFIKKITKNDSFYYFIIYKNDEYQTLFNNLNVVLYLFGLSEVVKIIFSNHKHLDRVNSNDVVMNEKLNTYSNMKYKYLQFFKYSPIELYQKYLDNKIYKKE